MKTGFQIVSPCCTYVSIVMSAAFDDISVPGFCVRAQHDPEKTFILKIKRFFSYHDVASVFDM